MIGPWTDQETEHQETIAAAFNKLYPNVKFSFKLFDWERRVPEVDASLADGAHDIYYSGEGVYLARAEQKDGFEDLTARINDPAFADEKAKYLYWDRLEAYGPKLIGLPVCWHVEDALFVNMDLVKAAGFDETWSITGTPSSIASPKMTKGSDTYGLGIGMQLGGFAEWYQRARAAGGSYLNADLSAPAINTPEVIEATQQLVDFFQKGIAPPQGTFDYNSGAGCSHDRPAQNLFLRPDNRRGSPRQAESTLPSSGPCCPIRQVPRPASTSTTSAFYAMSSKTPDKDLAWEVVKWWTNGEESRLLDRRFRHLPGLRGCGRAGL